MKVLIESKKSGVRNFGTVYEYYAKPYTVEIDKSGKIWQVTAGKKKLFKSKEFPWKAIALDELKEIYPAYLAKSEEYEIFY